MAMPGMVWLGARKPEQRLNVVIVGIECLQGVSVRIADSTIIGSVWVGWPPGGYRPPVFRNKHVGK